MKLNFNEIERPELEIELNDGEKTKLTLIIPTEKAINNFENTFKNLVANNKKATMDDVYTCSAELLSFNKENKPITSDYLRTFFSIDDNIVLFRTYMSFITGFINQKN